jgi:hypothetical protein
MTDIEKLNPAPDLQILLDEHGIAAPDGMLADSEELSVCLGVTRLYGVETELPSGGLGRLVVRQVEQLPSPYVQGLAEDRPEVQEFYGHQLKGLFADVQIRSVSASHLLVARRSLLRMQSDRGTSMTSFAKKQFVLGKSVDIGRMLEFDMSGLSTTRELEPAEMEYSEPGRAAMLLSARARKR